MSFVDNKKKVKVVFKGGYNSIIYSSITDIGEVEGFSGFIGLYRNSEEIPSYLIAKDDILTLELLKQS